MQKSVVTAGPLASASANALALSQTPTAGALTLNGALATSGVVTMDNPRQVLITTAADESAHTFTIIGTDWAGSRITETVTGPNVSTAPSILSYKTVTSITISANATGALTVGTNGIGSSQWVRFDGYALPNIAKQLVVTGTVNYTVQQSMDDPNSPTSPVLPSAMTWVNDPDLQFVAATAGGQGFWNFIPIWGRVVLNSGTGTVSMRTEQAGSAVY